MISHFFGQQIDVVGWRNSYKRTFATACTTSFLRNPPTGKSPWGYFPALATRRLRHWIIIWNNVSSFPMDAPKLKKCITQKFINTGSKLGWPSDNVFHKHFTNTAKFHTYKFIWYAKVVQPQLLPTSVLSVMVQCSTIFGNVFRSSVSICKPRGCEVN